MAIFDLHQLSIATRAGRDLDPSDVVAAAEVSTSAEEAMTNAGGVRAFGGALKLKTNLEQQDDAIQIRYWLRAKREAQDLLMASGYRLPMHNIGAVEHAKRGSGGLFSAVDIFNSVGETVVGAVGTAIDVSGVDSVVSETLHRAGSPLRFAQHAYRAAIYAADDPTTEHETWWGFGEFKYAWDQTKDGQNTFDPRYEQEARDKYGDDLVELAKLRAAGGAEAVDAAILKSLDESKRREFSKWLENNKELDEATRFMDASHISYGHTVLDPSWAVNHPEIYDKVTGAFDAAFDWYGDPLVIAGKAYKATQIAKYGLHSAADVHLLFLDTGAKGAAVRREAESVIGALTRNGTSESLLAGDLRALKPKWSKVAEDLVREGVDSVPKLREWLAGEVGAKALFEGRLAGFHSPVPTLPVQTRFGAMTEWAAQNAGRIIDVGADAGAPGRTMIRRLTTLTPTKGVQSLGSAESGIEVGRLARIFLPEARARDIESAWAIAEKENIVGIRRDLYRGFVDEIRNAVGGDRNSAFWDSIFGEIEGADGYGQMYTAANSAGGMAADLMKMGGTWSHEGFLATQRSIHFSLPNVQELFRQASKTQMLGLQSDAMTRFMNAWKISVILRPAFALRAGGEELVEAMMRYSPKAIAQSRMALSSLKADTDKLVSFHPLAAMYDGIIKASPPEIAHMLETVGKPADLVAEYLWQPIRRAVRKGEGMLAGEEYMRAAHRAARTPEYQDMFERFVTASHDGVNAYLGDIELGHKVLNRQGVLVPAVMSPTGRWGRQVKGDTATSYHVGYAQGLREIAHDPVARQQIRTMLMHDGLATADEITVRSLSDIQVAKPGRTVEEMQRTRREAMVNRGARTLGSNVTREWRGDFARNSRNRDGIPVWKPAPSNVLDEIKIEKLEGGYSLASTNTAERRIRINAPALDENYRLGMRYERGALTGPDGAVLAGSEQKRAVFEAQGIDVSELQQWFDEHGGAAAYRRFVIEHEKAHILLDHGGTSPAELLGDASLRKEMEANNIAFEKLKMPFGTHGDHGPLITDVNIPPGYISQEEAWRDWSAVTADHVTHMLTREDGTVNAALAERVLAGDLPSWDEIASMPLEDLPFHVKGPELETVHVTAGDRLRALIDYGFHEAVGKPMDWMIRQPMYLHNYTIGLRRGEAMAARFEFAKPEAREKYVTDIATHYAVDASVPFIHDPRLKSQFAVQTRNLFPFWFAQEQFYKRVARTFLYNPAAARQAQLVVSGFRHVGVLTQDANGDDYFMFPVVGQMVQEFLSTAVSQLTRTDAKLPIPVGFSGQLKMASPGLDRLGAPAFAPWVGVAAEALGSKFPELAGVIESVEGGSPKHSMWEFFLPSQVSGVIHSVVDDKDRSSQLFSARMQAMLYLEANGHGPDSEEYKDLPEADRWQIFDDRATQWARTIMATRAITGFVAPAAPTVEIGGIELHKEFVEDISKYGYEEGFKQFIADNPDMWAFTVFPTKSNSGGPLPVTRAAFRYMDKHADLLQKYPRAAGWLLPMDPPKMRVKVTDDKVGTALAAADAATAPTKDMAYEPRAYREQLAWEMRTRKPTLKDVWREIKFAEAKDEYFDEQKRKDAALAASTDPAYRRQVRDIWSDWSKKYKKEHPVFADQLDSPEGVQRRQKVMDELKVAVMDDSWPTDKQATHLKEVVVEYDKFKGMIEQVRSQSQTKAVKEYKAQVQGAFLNWMDEYSGLHPDVDLFYKMIVLPDVDKQHLTEE